MSFQFIWIYDNPSGHPDEEAPKLEIYFSDANGN